MDGTACSRVRQGKRLGAVADGRWHTVGGWQKGKGRQSVADSRRWMPGGRRYCRWWLMAVVRGHSWWQTTEGMAGGGAQLGRRHRAEVDVGGTVNGAVGGWWQTMEGGRPAVAYG